jgi:tetratricopeptide (TPR) repeat protein
MPENSSIQVGSGKRKSEKPRWQFVAVLIAVVILALGAGAWLRWWQQDDRAEPEEQPSSVSRAENLTLNGNYEQAHKTVNDALADPNLSDDEKYDLLIQQGIIYENQNDVEAAMASYRRAESVKETADVDQSIARMAEELGDKQLAIEYYKKAIPLIPQDDPTRESLKIYFENKIRVLEGGEPVYEQ